MVTVKVEFFSSSKNVAMKIGIIAIYKFPFLRPDFNFAPRVNFVS
jgi:hypothetical protein